MEPPLEAEHKLTVLRRIHNLLEVLAPDIGTNAAGKHRACSERDLPQVGRALLIKAGILHPGDLLSDRLIHREQRGERLLAAEPVRGLRLGRGGARRGPNVRLEALHPVRHHLLLRLKPLGRLQALLGRIMRQEDALV